MRNGTQHPAHSFTRTVRRLVPVYSDCLTVTATETRECWCRMFPVFLSPTPIDDRASFPGSVGSWERPVRRYASPSG